MFDNERQLMAQLDELRKAVERLEEKGLVNKPAWAFFHEVMQSIRDSMIGVGQPMSTMFIEALGHE